MPNDTDVIQSSAPRSGHLAGARTTAPKRVEGSDSGIGDESRERRSRSHSQLSQWLRCGAQFRLARIDKVPDRPGLWLPGGTAVHAVIETYLREKVTNG